MSIDPVRGGANAIAEQKTVLRIVDDEHLVAGVDVLRLGRILVIVDAVGGGTAAASVIAEDSMAKIGLHRREAAPTEVH